MIVKEDVEVGYRLDLPISSLKKASYSIIPSSLDSILPFQIDEDEGIVKTKEKLDREKTSQVRMKERRRWE